jgi:two-component system sensor histidine kinase RegB
MSAMRKTGMTWLNTLLRGTTGELRSAPRISLQRLLVLRVLVMISGVLGAMVFDFFSPLNLPVPPIAALLAGIIASLALGVWRVRKATLINTRELAAHLALDFLFLTALLIYTGGATNPLISYLLVLLAVGATLLNLFWANIFAAIAIGVYTVLLLVGIATDQHAEHLGPDFQVHLVGMWVTFVVSALLITAFVSRMAQAIRSRELTLAKARENEMRNEQLVAIGTLAAGTAHALGTPLSTMAVLLAELDEQTEEQLRQQAVKADIHLLREQVVRCKNSLDQLTRFYNKNDQSQPGQLRLRSFDDAVRDYITNIHPSARIEFKMEDACRDLLISSDITIRHALINIIENAIKAARSQISVYYYCASAQRTHILMSVQDDGPGIPPEIMESMGEPFISTRSDSMGLGIFLANASIQRQGGSIEMFNVKNTGARTVIRLPVSV